MTTDKRSSNAVCGAVHWVDQSYRLPDIKGGTCNLPKGHEGRHEARNDDGSVTDWWCRKASEVWPDPDQRPSDARPTWEAGQRTWDEAIAGTPRATMRNVMAAKALLKSLSTYTYVEYSDALGRDAIAVAQALDEPRTQEATSEAMEDKTIIPMARALKGMLHLNSDIDEENIARALRRAYQLGARCSDKASSTDWRKLLEEALNFIRPIEDDEREFFLRATHAIDADDRRVDYAEGDADLEIERANVGHETPAPVALSSGRVCWTLQREIDRATDETRPGLLKAYGVLFELVSATVQRSTKADGT